MKQSILLCPPLLAVLAFTSSANAGTLYASPTAAAPTAGTTSCCTRDVPCDLSTAASAAMAGDTVVLMDGIYKTALYVANSGTPSAWITFQADDCATPIIEGAIQADGVPEFATYSAVL